MRSNNTPLPVADPSPPAPEAPAAAAPAPPAAAAQAVALTGRALELVASLPRITRGRTVRLSGSLEAFANQARCQAGQEVQIQRRRGTTSRYTTIARVRTRANGGFRSSARMTRTAFFRARVSQTAECMGAVSAREQVQVKPAVRRR
jgi:hypothetical protein